MILCFFSWLVHPDGMLMSYWFVLPNAAFLWDVVAYLEIFTERCVSVGCFSRRENRLVEAM